MSGNAVRALALQPDGKIIVAGQLSFNGLANAAVHRFHPNGAPDTGFGLGGIREFDNGGAEIAHAVALQRDGRIVAAGNPSAGRNVAVFRLNPDGSPDTTFGAGGTVATGGGGDEKAFALAVQPDGKIVAAGATSVNGDAAVFRRNPNRSPDTSFDGDGAVAIDGGETEEAHGLALQPDGKIVVAGSPRPATTSPSIASRATRPRRRRRLRKRRPQRQPHRLSRRLRARPRPAWSAAPAGGRRSSAPRAATRFAVRRGAT